MKPWVKFGLLWALWMIVFMVFVSPYLMVWLGFDEVPEEQPPLKIAIFAVMLTIAGLIVGYVNRNGKKIKKQIDV
ncbi:hypothetical protein R1T16_15435 [Flavobacterium sp. DG1-102-2]|uniref:hypothetical protein n=1 Tax=Flavobacterium sp. DG1-102-2 TaxID=3081663 RepID=UPI00294909CF|nr:hypothetical protein [Flavobacterium sp. DG1-102-2]MDV6169829.1 hypothetical protein [Flavobacterium sp. DG1-102-2]